MTERTEFEMRKREAKTSKGKHAARTLGMFAGLWILSASMAFAQGLGTPEPTDSKARKAAELEGFQPVAGAPDTEKVDANKLVVAAYAAIFVGVFGYVVYMARSQGEMAKEMAELAAQISRVEKKS